MVTRAIEKAQRRVEEQNFGSRKTLLEYDDVMNQQRQVVYKRRNDLLKKGEGADFIDDVSYDLVRNIVEGHSPQALNSDRWLTGEIAQALTTEFQNEVRFNYTDEIDITAEQITEEAHKQLMATYNNCLLYTSPSPRDS